MLKTNKYIKNFSFCPGIKMQDLSLNELKLIAKNRNISGYKSIVKDKLLGIIDKNKRDRKSLFKS